MQSDFSKWNSTLRTLKSISFSCASFSLQSPSANVQDSEKNYCHATCGKTFLEILKKNYTNDMTLYAYI